MFINVYEEIILNNKDIINKKELRKQILKSRDKLDNEISIEKSRKATENVVNSEIFAKAENIMVFSSFRSEIETIDIINAIFANRKKLFMPLSMMGTNEIVTCLISSMNDLELGNYEILEPKKQSIFIGDSKDLDLIIIPGAAFDMEGHRIGYGAGYYDRLLSRPDMKAVTVGLCFDMQIVPYVPNSKHDKSLNYLVTEKGVCKIEKLPE